MSLFKQTSILLRSELRAEFRQPFHLAGVILYVLSAVLIVYVALTHFSVMVWNPLFWVLLFFSAISAANRSFQKEQGHRQLYYYSLISPEALLISKIIYNTVLLTILGLLLWGLLIIFNGGDVIVDPVNGEAITISGGNPIKAPALFLAIIFLGSLGLSAAFCFVAAISTRAKGNATLMSILAFPLVIPLLIVLVRLGGYAIGLLGGDYDTPLLLLIAIDLLLVAMGMILFPFVWRD